MCWQHLIGKLKGVTTIATVTQQAVDEILCVGPDYVTLRSKRTGQARLIRQKAIEKGTPNRGAIRALRQLAGCNQWK